MGSLGRRRILRARGSTSALIEAAAAAGGEGAARVATAVGGLDAARRRPTRAAALLRRLGSLTPQPGAAPIM